MSDLKPAGTPHATGEIRLAADGGWQRVKSWVDCPTGGDQERGA